MTKYMGGEHVKAGFYWNFAEWNAHIAPPEGGPLPGKPDAAYVRLPLLAVLVLAPAMGALYAFFLPFIGFAMLVAYLAGRLRRPATTPPAVEAAGTVVTMPKKGVKVARVEEDVRKAA
jgi:hypothetical protein